ncbi:aspartate--tRNA ligase [Mycoplasma mycoides]|uniref:aspartate--tRNA ligase n=1 Tax=Mycoplasma mycoides TaxID=2102 RepID=UPI002736F226|nr:aspartate--tRNA ligase [Mycoplasma mycoides]MDP4040173.1 aspartate--tRNA ligase [Mycoplasma mycoides]MDP4041040.1 aspartate--tRNA ligase [Mycoplasma mycoides]MDP4042015.1 aspartate--tRNA ligase [Mycoplasma mycoides]MDP4043892.1 aspartate--tRNA ligase [Mycoplasma mycoides]MDP4044812.1 aspartate--tRNA ligase [Mycoplasma mycoides]
MKRTHTCGELTINNIDQEVILQGWVKKIRKLGAMVFIDLKDRYGITQLVVDQQHIDLINNVKNEYVIEIKGNVVKRKSVNKELVTGDIEVIVKELLVINKSELTPFVLENDVNVNEDTRLTYRYLDLRRPVMQNNLIIRAKINHIIRNFLTDSNFLEVETPYFAKSTPEGARDFLVPSRLNKNKFYALPQSPQLFKQLLMISGIDRYYQIVRCFRDEDLRIDRQPEFTQLDLEMSFATSEDVMQISESLIKKILKEVKNFEIKEPLLRLSYKDAIDLYGSDKPDLRYDLKIHTLNDIFKNTNIKFLNNSDLFIRAICIDQLLSKKQLEDLNQQAKQFHFNSIAFIKFENNNWSGSLASQLTENEKELLIKEFDIKNKATIILNIGKYAEISQLMGAIRISLAKMFNLETKDDFKLLWVVDFPLFEFSEQENRYVAAHHPFTSPKEECLTDFDTNKKDALACAYDLVMNGFEIGGGSQRITNPEIQQRMFDAVELTAQQVETNFGWFMNAYKYGAPYHAGIAWGLDRISMILTDSNSIRDVIAFPKNSLGIDMMNNAPDLVSEKQLEELNIKIVK